MAHHEHTYTALSEITPFSDEYNWVRCDECHEWTVDRKRNNRDNLYAELPREVVPVQEEGSAIRGICWALIFELLAAALALLVWRFA
jgi:hypothetical protein